MKPFTKLLVILVFSMAASIANADFIKIPVDSSVTAASGTRGYDPTVVGNDSPSTGWSVQPATISPNGSLTAQSTVSTAGTTVGSLIRWPAGGKPERTMQGARAYYRDAFIGIRYTAQAAQNGDAWTTKAVYPTEDGGSRTQATDWFPVTYYEQVGSWSSCWYSAGWLYYICGTKSLDITAYMQSQCNKAGNWAIQIYQNGIAVSQPSLFIMRLEVPPTSDTPENPLIALNQNTSPRYPYDSVCYRLNDITARVACNPDPSQPDPADPRRFLDPSDLNLRAFSIGKKGCALTAAAMVNAYHNGANDSLISYNDSMKNNNGFSATPGAIGLVDFRNAPRGVTSFIKYGSNANPELRKMICTHGPQVMSVKGGAHFVMVVGREGLTANDPWKIFDPADGTVTNLSAKSYTLQAKDGTRLFRGPDAQYAFPLYGIQITLHSPAELIVTAPDGLKTGFDPISGQLYNGISSANYLAEGYDDDETGEIEPHKVKFVSLTDGPPDGEYSVQVIGTDSGTYKMSVERIGNDGRLVDTVRQIDIPTEYGAVHTYAVQYSATSAQPPVIAGGYDGGGQKPVDVNKFLRYSNPSAAHNSLAAGATQFRLAISYGNTTIPGTFKATLNGVEVSTLFSPAAGVSQIVQLPLSRGTNTLVLATNGQTPSGRIATDTDRLVFNVP